MDADRFQALLKEKAACAEEILKQYLPQEAGYQKTVLEAMNYSLLAGGKRLRPVMMAETFRMFGGEGRLVEPFMAAIEMIHTYSLVHDDLPAMDNDEYRRGRRTTWAVYGDAFGILAGDGLLNYAFETALRAFDVAVECADGKSAECADEKVSECADGKRAECVDEKAADDAARRMRAVAEALQVLARKAGVYGMIGGQTADIEAEGQTEPLASEQLLFIHEHKTAALIQASMMVGAILAGADSEQIARIEKCAYNIGIAFQIQDDILDVIGDSEELGKPVGSDAQNHKQTYVTLKGLEQSQKDVESLSAEAKEILRQLPGEHFFLEELVEYLIHRRS